MTCAQGHAIPHLVTWTYVAQRGQEFVDGCSIEPAEGRIQLWRAFVVDGKCDEGGKLA